MSSLKRAFLPVLLASTTALVGCGRDEKEDARAMAYAIQSACTEGAIESQKFECLNTAIEQASFLATQLKAKGKFAEACDFQKPVEVEPFMEMVLQLEASRVRGCLTEIDKNASPAVRTITAEIHKGLSRGMQ